MKHMPEYRKMEGYREFLYQYLVDNMTCDEDRHNLLESIAFRLCFIVTNDRQIENTFWDEIFSFLPSGHPANGNNILLSDSTTLFFDDVRSKWLTLMGIESELVDVLEV